MFFSPDLLCKQNGNIATVWLAATLSNKKLSKRDYLRVNLVDACDFISHPPQPLALRFSSNLMVGILRVYNHQCSFHYSSPLPSLLWILLIKDDVKNVFMRLKSAFTLSDNQMYLPDMNKHDGITLPHLPALDRGTAAPVSANASNLEAFGWVSAAVDSFSSSLVVTSPTDNISNLFILHDPANITLDENHAHGGFSASVSRQTSNANDLLISGSAAFSWNFDLDPPPPHSSSSVSHNEDLNLNFGEFEVFRNRKKRVNSDSFDIDDVHHSISVLENTSGFNDVKQVSPHQQPLVNHSENNTAKTNQRQKRPKIQFDSVTAQPMQTLLEEYESGDSILLSAEIPAAVKKSDLYQCINYPFASCERETWKIELFGKRTTIDVLDSVEISKNNDDATEYQDMSALAENSVELGRNVTNSSSSSREAAPWDNINDETVANLGHKNSSHRVSSTDGSQSEGRYSIGNSDVLGFDNELFIGNGVNEAQQLNQFGNNMEQDVIDLYSYLDQRAKGQILFSDIMENKKSRQVASRLFHNILVLSTLGEIKIEQKMAYGEIELFIV